MSCRVDLTREFFRGLAIALGLVLLITGPFFAALKPWLGPALFALGAVLSLYGLRIPTRWCLSEGRLCLGRRCYDLSRLKGYEVRAVGVGFCREERLYLVFEDQKVPFPTAVEGADRLALALFGEVPEVLRPKSEPALGESSWREDLWFGLELAFFYLVADWADRLVRDLGWGPALLFFGGALVAAWQLRCLWERRAKL